ncbi:hypothetical protein ABEO87_07055 [Geobacillus stearothermophilus]|uniref:hypothetical protein n=1 Tax=Geobacillus stearothermophilus TaxID=1422 RepID=UPI003D1E76C8
MEWKLTSEKYRQLLSFIGYGNFREADMIVFGNEEGTGDYGIEENVEARIRYYGKNEAGEYVDCFNVNDLGEGFWESSKEDKIARYLREQYGDEIEEKFYTKGTFLPTVARICLALECDRDNIGRWFRTYDECSSLKQAIQLYILNELFTKREGLQTCLSDWRPLPRPSERVWPKEYSEIWSDHSKENPYLKAFDKPNARGGIKTDFSNFTEDVKRRMEVLKKAFIASTAKVVLCLGGANGMKKTVLKEMFQLRDRDFSPLDVRADSQNNLSSYRATVHLEHKDLHIFLLPFPQAGYGFRDGKSMLRYYQQVTERYLYPILGRMSNDGNEILEDDVEMRSNGHTSKGRPRWTREENLCIYHYLDLFPQKSAREIAVLIKENERFSKIINRSIGAIAQHIDQLKTLQGDLNVPDPVHNNKRGFHDY